MRISATTKKWLLGTHLVFASIWIGAIAALFALSIQALWAKTGPELHTLHETLRTIEYTMIIPPAFGSLITGGLLSWWTNWGFFRYKWVLIKWILTLSLILFGAVCLNTWIEGMAGFSKTAGIQATQNKTYIAYMRLHLLFVPIQWLILLFMVFLSLFKPWGKRGQNLPSGKEKLEEKTNP